MPDELTLRDEPRTLLAAANILRARGSHFASVAVLEAMRGMGLNDALPEITRERVDWLRAVISAVRNGDYLHEDPSAVLEAVWNCEQLAADLERLVVPEPIPVGVMVHSDADIPF